MQLFASNYDSLNVVVSKMLDYDLNDQMMKKLNILQNKLDSYSFKFDTIVSSGKIGIDNTLVLDEVDLAREIHTLIKEIKSITIQDFNKGYAVTNNVNIFSVLIGLFLSVLIAGFISTKIMDIIGHPDE